MKEKLEKELSDWKRKLEAMKKNNLTAGIAKSEKEIARIEGELLVDKNVSFTPKFKVGDIVSMFRDENNLKVAEVNEWSDKQPTYDLVSEDGKTKRNNIPENKIYKVDKKKAKASKSKPKSKLGKSVKQIIEKEETGDNAMVSVDTEKGYKYNSTVKKVSDEHYIVLYQSDTTKDAEIKFVDGQWELICKEVKDYPKFSKSQVEMAINFVLEVKDCIHSKTSRMEQAKKRKEIRAKYDKKTESEKAENAVDKAAESVENRVEEVKEEGKEITKKAADNIALDVKSIVKAVKSGMKKENERKKFIQKLIKELQKML